MGVIKPGMFFSPQRHRGHREGKRFESRRSRDPLVSFELAAWWVPSFAKRNRAFHLWICVSPWLRGEKARRDSWDFFGGDGELAIVVLGDLDDARCRLDEAERGVGDKDD